MSAEPQLSEFALIDRFFASLGAKRSDVVLGVGDDGAILTPRPGQELIAVTDTLVEGRHFLPQSSAASIGHRALAVNLSDIAAMGASPAWALLALTLPRADARWLEDFAQGFGALAQRCGVALVGGDTTAGPLSVSVTVLGHVPSGCALRRSGGRSGDVLFVSGTPGDAARGLELEMQALGARSSTESSLADTSAASVARRSLRERFNYPQPRLALGQALRGLASACIDVSDGLAGDAAKLARASGCGLNLDAALLPLSESLTADVGVKRAERYALSGGDDYELCFAVPASKLKELAATAAPSQFHYSRIGELTKSPEVVIHRAGKQIELPVTGFDHFA